MTKLSFKINSHLSIDQIYNRIKTYKSSGENLFYMIHSNNENQVVFGKNQGQLLNLPNSVNAVFKLYPLNSDGFYKIDVTYEGFGTGHYLIILFILFFAFMFNTFLFMMIIGIFGIEFYPVYLLVVWLAYYIFLGKPIKKAINNEIKLIERILNLKKKKVSHFLDNLE